MVQQSSNVCCIRKHVTLTSQQALRIFEQTTVESLFLRRAVSRVNCGRHFVTMTSDGQNREGTFAVITIPFFSGVSRWCFEKNSLVASVVFEQIIGLAVIPRAG